MTDWWDGDLEHAVEDLWLYADNTRELYEMKRSILTDSKVYDERLAFYAWQPWINRAAQMYVHEIILHRSLDSFTRNPPSPSTVDRYIPLRIRVETAKEVAQHERTVLIGGRKKVSPDLGSLSPEEELGVRAIIALQKLAGVDEPRERALRGWRGMNRHERDATLRAYAMFRPPS